MKESKNFYSSIFLLIFLNVIIKPLWIFGIDRQVQNIAGTEIYGSYFSLLNFSIVFSFLLDWGVTSYFNRHLALQEESVINRSGYFLSIKLLFFLLYAVVVCTVAYFTGITNWNILFLLIIIQALTSLFIFLRSIVTAMQWFKTDAWLSVVDKCMMLIICGAFFLFPVVFGKINIEIFLEVQILCTSLAIVVVFVILHFRGFRFKSGSNGLNYLFLNDALPFALIVLLMSAHYRLDGYLLERLHPRGAYEAGIYAGSYRLLDAANMFGYLISSFLLPFISNQFVRSKNIDSILVNSRHILFIFSLVIIITVIFLSPWIQEILYYNNDKYAVTIMQWCLPALFGYSFVHIYGTALTATGEIIPFCKITFVAVIINVTLNLILIPDFGAMGCCIAAILSQLFCGIATMLYLKRKRGIKIHFNSLLIYTFIGAILVVFYYLGKSAGLNNWLLIMTSGIIAIITSLSTGLFKLNKWKIIFRNTTN